LFKLVGEETGPVSGNPPAVSKETKAALADAAKSSPTGSHVPGQDADSKVETTGAADGEKKVKSEKERTGTSLFCVDVTLCSN
jgi:valyl-tRNA synthetase